MDYDGVAKPKGSFRRTDGQLWREEKVLWRPLTSAPEQLPPSNCLQAPPSPPPPPSCRPGILAALAGSSRTRVPPPSRRHSHQPKETKSGRAVKNKKKERGGKWVRPRASVMSERLAAIVRYPARRRCFFFLPCWPFSLLYAINPHLADPPLSVEAQSVRPPTIPARPHPAQPRAGSADTDGAGAPSPIGVFSSSSSADAP